MGCNQSKSREASVVALGHTARLPRLSSQSTPEKYSTSIKGKAFNCKTDETQELPKLDANGRMLWEEVERRRTFSDMATTTIEIGGGKTIRVRYASSTQRGYYPDEPSKNNQDAISITKKFAGEDGDLFFGVYDGHGSDGDDCAQYARDHLPKLMSKYIRQERASMYREQREHDGIGLESGRGIVPFNPKLWPMLDAECYERACRNAHLECNRNMLADIKRVSLSGTTSISAGFHNGQFTISNVGDSRAVLGLREQNASTSYSNESGLETWFDNGWEEKKEYEPAPPAQDREQYHQHDNDNMVEAKDKLVAIPLSVDQTSWRKDERKRIKAAGGRVLTIDQIEGRKPILSKTACGDNDDDEFGDRILGTNDDTIDIAGDPPRVWLPNEPIPGTAFTRSFGDNIAKKIGVHAEPEMCTKDITGMVVGSGDEVLVLASDGVFEFLTNQQVIDICHEVLEGGGCVVDACRKIMDRSYEKWVEYENRTDDISVIVIWMDTP